MSEARAQEPMRHQAIQETFHERHPGYHNRWYAAHREEICRRKRERYAVDLEASRAAQRAKQRAHPALYAKHTATRRARKLEAFVEEVDREIVWVRDEGICGLCARPIEGAFHVDHVMPLSRGGQHCYSNVQLAHPECNLAKRNKMPTLAA